MECTKILSEYVYDAKFDDFPKEVVEKAKSAVLDYLGCAIGGGYTQVGKACVELISATGGAEEATIIGKGIKAPLAGAAFANAALSNILDFDDTYGNAAHPGNTIVSAAVAAAEASKVSGREFITGVIVGYEIATRIGMATRLSKEKVQRLFTGWSWQAMGAVAACSKIMGLNKDQIYHAFGLCGTVVPAPLAVPKFQLKPLYWFKNGFAWAAYTSVFWTQLAKMGVLGNVDVFDDPGGFWEIIGSDQYFEEDMIAGLGEKYLLLDLDFKPFPSCRWTHSSITAIDELVRENDIKVEDIKEVRLSSLNRVNGFMDYPPKSMADAQFCYPYMIAMALMQVVPGPDWFDEARMSDPKVIELQAKISHVRHPDADHLFEETKGCLVLCDAEIETNDGSVFEKTIEYAKGSPQYPLSKEELIAKFRNLTKDFDKRKQDDMIFWAEELDNAQTFSLPI